MRADNNLQNLEKFTKPLADRGDALVHQIETSVGMITELLDQLVKFSASLNNNEGSLGPLLHDRELYDRLSRTARNVEDATKQLKPILGDVRIFTDKIARDPRQLGVKGALDKNPSNTGMKNPPAMEKFSPSDSEINGSSDRQNTSRAGGMHAPIQS